MNKNNEGVSLKVTVTVESKCPRLYWPLLTLLITDHVFNIDHYSLARLADILLISLYCCWQMRKSGLLLW